jgi:NADPH:quinone reductase-like Zn-dependent oxidoreductase
MESSGHARDSTIAPTICDMVAMRRARATVAGRVAVRARQVLVDEIGRVAATLPLAGLTAWQALVDIAGLQAGQRVLIHAGSGVTTATGTDNVGGVRELGAGVVIDYRKEDFSTQPEGYGVVLNSQDKDVLEKSLQVLKPGGHLVSTSGPPTPAFAAREGMSWPMRLGVPQMSRRIRARAKRRGVHHSFLCMHPDGLQLDKQAADALAYVERGRTKGKVVITGDRAALSACACWTGPRPPG